LSKIIIKFEKKRKIMKGILNNWLWILFLKNGFYGYANLIFLSKSLIGEMIDDKINK
jgi:hypothetical protein